MTQWVTVGTEYSNNVLLTDSVSDKDNQGDNLSYRECPGTNVHSALTIARICFSEYVQPTTMTGRPISRENRMCGVAANCQTKCSRPNPAATQSYLSHSMFSYQTMHQSIQPRSYFITAYMTWTPYTVPDVPYMVKGKKKRHLFCVLAQLLVKMKILDNIDEGMPILRNLK